MSELIELHAKSDHYSNNKQYIARITGRNSKYTFEREFIGKKSAGSYSTTDAKVDEPGLYELAFITKKEAKFVVYRLVIETSDGLQLCRAGSDNLDGADADAVVRKIATRLDGGEKFSDIIDAEKKQTPTDEFLWGWRLRSKAQAAKASEAVTVESAVQTCWEVLQALPEKQAKAVLKALKEKVQPPPSVGFDAETAETEQEKCHTHTPS